MIVTESKVRNLKFWSKSTPQTVSGKKHWTVILEPFLFQGIAGFGNGFLQLRWVDNVVKKIQKKHHPKSEVAGFTNLYACCKTTKHTPNHLMFFFLRLIHIVIKSDIRTIKTVLRIDENK